MFFQEDFIDKLGILELCQARHNFVFGALAEMRNCATSLNSPLALLWERLVSFSLYLMAFAPPPLNHGQPFHSTKDSTRLDMTAS